MDPDKTLQAFRDAIRRATDLVEQSDTPDDTVRQQATIKAGMVFSEAAGHALQLDYWLSSQGSLPKPWQR